MRYRPRYRSGVTHRSEFIYSTISHHAAPNRMVPKQVPFAASLMSWISEPNASVTLCRTPARSGNIGSNWWCEKWEESLSEGEKVGQGGKLLTRAMECHALFDFSLVDTSSSRCGRMNPIGLMDSHDIHLSLQCAENGVATFFPIGISWNRQAIGDTCNCKLIQRPLSDVNEIQAVSMYTLTCETCATKLSCKMIFNMSAWASQESVHRG